MKNKLMKMMLAALLVIVPCLWSSVVMAQMPNHDWQSRIIVDTIQSKILNAPREVSIFLPKGFNLQTDKKYPVLYLLHGMWDTHVSWPSRGHVKDVMDRLTASKEACDMIIVTPNAGGNINTEWNGYFNMPGWDYETFFYDELMPYVESKYRVVGDKQHRAIAGLSMGGGGATNYAQRHSDKFCAAYAMSALMSIPEQGAVGFDDPNSKIAILTRSVIDNSCVDYVLEADDARKDSLRQVEWFVDCGDDDFLLDRNLEFFQAMRNAVIPCQLRVRDGGHDWEYWNSALYTCLPFVTRSFGK